MKVMAVAIFLFFLTGVYLNPCNFYSVLTESYGSSAVQTADLGFAIAGFTTFKSITQEDVFIIKTDQSGDKVWEKQIGGKYEDGAFSIIENHDKDLIVCGFTDPSGTKNYESWIIKISEKGTPIWNKTIKNKNGSACLSIIQDADGGYTFTGMTNYSASPDILITKIDKAGKKLWAESYGGDKTEVGLSIVAAKDGGYTIAGYTDSSSNGKDDVIVIHSTKKGKKVWSKTFGGPEVDRAHSIILARDGSYVVTGFTQSFGAGSDDVWLIKLDSKGNHEWNYTFGGVNSDRAFSVVQASDGGFAMTGYTSSFGVGKDDLWVVKTDQNGIYKWNRTFGGIEKDQGRSIIQTIHGPLAVVGYTNSYEKDKANVWLLKSHCDPESFVSNFGCQLESSTSPPEECRCPIGKHFITPTECIPCKAGYYNNLYSNDHCHVCPPGKFSLEGAAFCSNCPNGTYSPKNGSSECITCHHSCEQCTIAKENAGCLKCGSKFKLVKGQCIEKTSSWPKYMALLVVLLIFLGMAYSIYYKGNDNEPQQPPQAAEIPLLPIEENKPEMVEKKPVMEEKKVVIEAKKSEEPLKVAEPPKKDATS